jgi:hypothetical protein
MGRCVSTIVGEEIISSFSSKICFCWIKGFEAAVVVVLFFASFEQTMKRMNFAISEITLWYYFCGAIVKTTFGIL